jgi:hypothetical protein
LNTTENTGTGRSGGGGGGSLKAFFILILFFLIFIMVASTMMGGMDLTPDTPNAAQIAAPTLSPITFQAQIYPTQQVINPPVYVQPIVPVTGGCADPYTVIAGDTLSKIAVNCSSTLAFLTQINPQMNNVDCMYPGQLINIFSLSVRAFAPCRAAAPIPVTAQPLPVVILPPTCDCYSAPIPVTGLYPVLRPGSQLTVRAINFPPNTPVNVTLGPRDVRYTLVASGVTDANGSLTVLIPIPHTPDAITPWQVFVITTSPTTLQAVSDPFTIGQ